jgi:acylphosphatase
MLELKGWIRNCADGSVEAVAEGQDDAVHEFASWMRTGPSSAKVDHLDIQADGSEECLPSFEIR